MEAIDDKTSEAYSDMAENFSKKLKAQEEIVSLELIRDKLGWQVGDRISFLENELSLLAAMEKSLIWN